MFWGEDISRKAVLQHAPRLIDDLSGFHNSFSSIALIILFHHIDTRKWLQTDFYVDLKPVATTAFPKERTDSSRVRDELYGLVLPCIACPAVQSVLFKTAVAHGAEKVLPCSFYFYFPLSMTMFRWQLQNQPVWGETYGESQMSQLFECFHLWYRLIFKSAGAEEQLPSLAIFGSIKNANVVPSCFYTFPMRSVINSGDHLGHLCSFWFIPNHPYCYIYVLSLYSSVNFSFIYPLIYMNQKNTLQRKFMTGKLISSIIDGFQIGRWALKVSLHHYGAPLLHAQPVFDKTNNSNEKSENNRQHFLFYGRCWRWLIYSITMHIWFSLLPWLFRFLQIKVALYPQRFEATL